MIWITRAEVTIYNKAQMRLLSKNVSNAAVSNADTSTLSIEKKIQVVQSQFISKQTFK